MENIKPKTKVIVFVTDGNEETELIGTVDVLRRADIQTIMVSVSGKKSITTSHGIILIADALWEEINFEDYQMLVFPGGVKAAEFFKKAPKIIQLVQKFHQENKYLAAICAAPIVLGKAGILTDKKAVCYSGFEQFLNCNEVSEAPVVIDKNVITAKSVAYTFDFSLAIIETLCGKLVRDEVAEKMLFPTCN